MSARTWSATTRESVWTWSTAISVGVGRDTPAVPARFGLLVFLTKLKGIYPTLIERSTSMTVWRTNARERENNLLFNYSFKKPEILLFDLKFNLNK